MFGRSACQQHFRPHAGAMLQKKSADLSELHRVPPIRAQGLVQSHHVDLAPCLAIPCLPLRTRASEGSQVPLGYQHIYSTSNRNVYITSWARHRLWNVRDEYRPPRLRWVRGPEWKRGGRASTLLEHLLTEQTFDLFFLMRRA